MDTSSVYVGIVYLDFSRAILSFIRQSQVFSSNFGYLVGLSRVIITPQSTVILELGFVDGVGEQLKQYLAPQVTSVLTLGHWSECSNEILFTQAVLAGNNTTEYLGISLSISVFLLSLVYQVNPGSLGESQAIISYIRLDQPIFC